MTETLGDLIVRLGVDVSGLESAGNAITQQMERIGTRLYFLGSRVTVGFSAPVTAAAGLVANFGLKFDQAMTSSLAILGDVTPKMRKLMEDQAKAVSENSQFSSEEAASAYYELASAGMNAAQSLTALPVVTKFAQAGVMDLAEATRLLAGAQTALGLRSNDAALNMMNLRRVGDVLTSANIKALGTVQDFATALSNRAGQELRLYNKSVEEGVAVLAAYAQQNILGARAGQQLYMTLRDLGQAATQHADHWKQLGVSVFDASGRMLNMADIIQQLERVLGPMSDKQRQAALLFLGIQSRAQGAILPLIGMSDEIRRLETELQKAGGTMDTVANKQMQSILRQLTAMEHSFQNVAIDIFGQFKPVIEDDVIPALKKLLDKFKELDEWLAKQPESTKEWILGMVAAAAALGPVIMAVGSFVLTVRAIVTPLALMSDAAVKMTGVAETLEAVAKASGTAGKAAAAVAEEAEPAVTWASRFGSALELLLTPVGMVVGAVAGLVAWLRISTGSWTGVYDALVAIFPPLAALEPVWALLKELLSAVAPVLKDVAVGFVGIVKVLTAYGLQAAVDVFMKLGRVLGDVGAKMREFVQIITHIGLDLLKDLLPQSIVDRFEDLRANWTTFTDIMHQGAQYWKEWGDQAWSAGTKATDATNKVKQNVQDILDRIRATGLTGPIPSHGSGFPPGNDNSDLGGSKVFQSVLDRLSGKKALEQAAAWSQAIRDLGGITKLTTDEQEQANRVFSEAGQKLTALGRGASSTAKSYAELWYATLGATNQMQVTSGLPSGLLSSLPKVPIGLDKKTFDQIDELNNPKVGVPSWLMSIGFRSTPKMSDLGPGYDWQQKFAKFETGLKSMSSSLSHLATISGGSFGGIVKGLSQTISYAQIGAEAGKNFVAGWHQLDSAKTGMEKFTGAANMGLSALEGITSVIGATGSGSTLSRSLNGLMAGASAGMAFGPLGAAVGAALGGVTGLVRGLFGDKTPQDVGKELASNFGRSFSDKLNQEIVQDVKGGMTEQGAMYNHLSEIVQEMGGVTASNFDQITSKTRDLFSMFDTGQLSLQQLQGQFNTVFGDLAQQLESTNGLASNQFLSLLKMNQQFGLNAQSVTSYLQTEAGIVASGFNAVAAGAFGEVNKAVSDLQGGMGTNGNFSAGALTALTKLRAQIADLQSKDSLTHGQQATLNADLQKEKALTGQVEQLTKIKGLASATQTEFTRMGSLAVASFASALASGQSFTDALNSIGPALDTLSTAETNFGFKAKGAFSDLLDIRKFTQAHQELAGEIGGLNQMMTGLHNIGMLDQGTFKNLGDEAVTTFKRVKSEGLSGNEALMVMQPTLQTLWELQQKFGFKVDEATQKMLNQGEKAGLVGEKMKSPQDQMITALNTMATDLTKLVKYFTGDFVGAVDTASDHVKNLGGKLSNLPTRINIDVSAGSSLPRYARGGYVAKPTLALIGEKGPEVVTPAGQIPTKVEHHTMIHSSLSSQNELLNSHLGQLNRLMRDLPRSIKRAVHLGSQLSSSR